MSHLAAPWPTVAAAAREELDFRIEQARRLIDAGRIASAQADAALDPWIAVAIHAGADLGDIPAFAQACAELRVAGTDGRDLYDEAQIRRIIAVNVCPRAVWRPRLAGLRERAAAEAARDPAARHARRILFLAEHLLPASAPGAPANPEHPPQPPAAHLPAAAHQPAGAPAPMAHQETLL